jgi:membrane-associated protein
VPVPAGQTGLNVWLCMVVFGLAAFIGDNVNYWFGYFLGPKVMRNENSRIFRKSYLDRTHAFFDHYGPTAVVAARFVPVVRTFAPFTAGVGRMPYIRFISFSLAGTVLWVGTFTMLGHFFGNIPWVQEHFELSILALVVISGAPIVFETLRRRSKARRAAAEAAAVDGPAEGDTAP